MKPHKLTELNSQLFEYIRQLPVGDWVSADGQEAIDLIVANGFTKKFDNPELEGNQSSLHAKCESVWLEDDSKLPDINEEIVFSYINPHRVSANLRDSLRSFSMDFGDGWTGPGETYLTNHGWVDSTTKLEGEWTVTPNCWPLFRAWLMAHRRIRRFIADSPLPTTEAPRKVCLMVNGKRLEFEAQREPLDLVDAARRACEADNEAYYYYKGIFKLKLMEKVRFVHGNRFASVPKNNEKRRPICVEPLGNMICQKMIGGGLRRILTAMGNDIDTGQDRHKELIGSGRYATIDLSNASDSISVALVKRIFPDWFVSVLMHTRSPNTSVDGEWIPLRKISSMGNGYTFELMTLIILITLRSELGIDDISVYGDDVIVPLEYYNAALWVLQDIGFTPNRDKCCGDGRKAESCGAFVVDGTYVTRFDVRGMESMIDLIVTANKIMRLLWADQVGGNVKSIIEKMGLLLLDHIPERFHGPRCPTEDIPLWFEVGLTRDKKPLENHVSQQYYGNAWEVSVCTKDVRKYQPGESHIAAIVGLKTGRRPLRHNKRRTIESEKKVLILNGLPLMAKTHWNEYQKLSRIAIPDDSGFLVKTRNGHP